MCYCHGIVPYISQSCVSVYVSVMSWFGSHHKQKRQKTEENRIGLKEPRERLSYTFL